MIKRREKRRQILSILDFSLLPPLFFAMQIPSIRLSSSFVFALLVSLALFLSANNSARGGALEDYVGRPDNSFSWKQAEAWETNGFKITRLDLVSQKWRDTVWNHTLIVVRPPVVRNPDIGFLFITGNGKGDDLLKVLEILAQRAGAVTALITQVPNEPLFDGKSEDALIAYTFDQYIKTGDQTRPLFFPMAKSALRGLDGVQEFARKQYSQRIEHFVVGGASKRGWTTWLAGAVDRRIIGIAPMVIDMLNMAAQTDWEEQVYGRPSEEVDDYNRAKIIARMHEPPMVQLRQWVDPYRLSQSLHHAQTDPARDQRPVLDGRFTAVLLERFAGGPS